MRKDTAAEENNMVVLQKLNTGLPSDPSIALLGIYS